MTKVDSGYATDTQVPVIRIYFLSASSRQRLKAALIPQPHKPPVAIAELSVLQSKDASCPLGFY